MISNPLLLAGAAGVLTAAVAAGPAARAWLRRRRRDHRQRGWLWERFYGLDWGDVTTNNYGFAPAESLGPERFQKQMYRELLKLLDAAGGLKAGAELLEVSCGRGGGLADVAAHWPEGLSATGLDLSQNALSACRQRFGAIPGLRFVHGSALALPFPDASFDVVINVEASNDYGDYAGFFREVRRVLRPGGAFLYCDTRRIQIAAGVEADLAAAGLVGRTLDITEHVLEACLRDSDRRLTLIRQRTPWWLRLLLEKDLGNYAAVEDSAKFRAFASRRRIYQMTCAFKVEALSAPPPPRSVPSALETTV